MTKIRQKSSRILLFFLYLPFCLYAASENQWVTPTPWTIKKGWWKELNSVPREELQKRVAELSQSLQSLEKAVPEESQNLVKVSVDRFVTNCTKFLELRDSTALKIEEAPILLESYTVHDFLLAAKEVKSYEARLKESTDELNRISLTHERLLLQIDHLYSVYEKTPQRSLQRTIAGLNTMIAISNRAIIEERMRLNRQQLNGIEEGLEWTKSILTDAKELLILGSLDKDNLDEELTALNVKKAVLDIELLQAETELASGKTNAFDTKPLTAVSKRITWSMANLDERFIHAKQALSFLLGGNLQEEMAQSFVKQSNSWIEELDDLDKRVKEWKSLVRREQDAAEKAFLVDDSAFTDTNGSNYKELFYHQKAVQESLLKTRDLELVLFQSRQLANVVLAKSIQELNWFSGASNRVYFELSSVLSTVHTVLTYTLFRINETPVTPLKIFTSIIVFLLAYACSVVVRHIFTKVAKDRKHISESSAYTFKRVTHYSILMIGAVSALSSLGVDFSNLLIIAGALSVGIGFGLQGIVNNFLGGLIVLFDRKLRVGDCIELSTGEMGNITEVNVQNTVIRTFTGHDILVPNSDIITRQLTNWTLRDQFARFHLPFGVSYGSDKEKVREVISEAAKRIDESVIGHRNLPDPNVWLVGFGDNSLDFELVVWVDFSRSKKRQSSLKAAYFWEIETALRENNIEIPFPQRDLHIRSSNVDFSKVNNENSSN